MGAHCGRFIQACKHLRTIQFRDGTRFGGRTSELFLVAGVPVSLFGAMKRCLVAMLAMMSQPMTQVGQKRQSGADSVCRHMEYGQRAASG